METGWSMQYFYSLHGHNRMKDIGNPEPSGPFQHFILGILVSWSFVMIADYAFVR